MKIESITDAALKGVQIVRFGHFQDDRGYFTEPFRSSELIPQLSTGSGVAAELVQMNESLSRALVIRGLHFQWNPYMGKLVRTISGHMVDIFLDIRLGSPSFGKIGMHDMPARTGEGIDEWIWVPPGFAHGNFFLEDTRIEYLCTGEYSPGCEAGISPMADDIDWSECDENLRSKFRKLIENGPVISDKDEGAMRVSDWKADPRSVNFEYTN